MSEGAGPRNRSDEILERLLSLHPKSIDLSLDRMHRILAALGNPERALPPVIHVAGTNGKGSVCAFIRAGLEAAGKRVHVYTSPHLARFHERIRLAGELIDEEALAKLLEECEAVNGGDPITFFEITTAAAFLAFSRTSADFCILEVGLGGRLDATNVIDDPALCVITPISLDHQSYLGDTIGAIAREKAGIVKRRVPLVVGVQPDEAEQAILGVVQRLDVPAHVSGIGWSVREEGEGFIFQYENGLIDLPRPALIGAHQIENAGIAAMALTLLGFGDEALLARAMTEVEWTARMQRLRQGPLVSAAPEGSEVWLDGGHNPAAGTALAHVFADMEERNPKPLYMICGMLNTKDPAGYLEPFEGLARRVYCVSIPGEAATLSGDELEAAAETVGLDAVSVPDVADAIRMIAGEESTDLEPPRILICGSLYLAGRVLRENG